MDPYLEAHWRDVHASLVYNGRNAIQRQLGSDLRARIEERLVIELDIDPVRQIYPDVRVFEKGLGNKPVVASGGVAVAEPLVVALETEEVRETSIHIIDVSTGGIVVTVIEFLSPTNKMPGDGKKQYRQKQEEVLAAGINLVEIDLTRAGERELLYPVVNLPLEYQTTYLACVRRGFGANRFEVYRMPLRERLPAIRIPLRNTDPDVVLDIQDLVDKAYEEGRYDDIDYSVAAKPPLAAEDAEWAAKVVAEHRFRR
jgi:hypothetical protein